MKVSLFALTLVHFFALATELQSQQKDGEFLPFFEQQHDSLNASMVQLQALVNVSRFDAPVAHNIADLLSAEQVATIDNIWKKHWQPFHMESIRNHLNGAKSSKDQDEAYQQMLVASEETYSQISEILGEQLPAAVKAVNRNLVFRTDTFDPTGLMDERLDKVLGLSSSQRAKIDALYASQGEQLKADGESLSKRKGALRKKHFQSVLKILTPTQRTEFTKWHGDLIDWDRLVGKEDLQRSLETLLSKEFAGGVEETTSYSRSSDDKFESDPPNDPITLEMEYVLYWVLQVPNLDTYLEITTDQRAEIRRKTVGNQVTLKLRRNSDQRLESILVNRNIFPDWLLEILIPRQLDWLVNFEFQVYTMSQSDSFGLLNQSVSNRLRLKDAQREAIVKLAREFAAEQQELSKGFAESLKKRKAAFLADTFAILEEEQLDQYRAYFGE